MLKYFLFFLLMVNGIFAKSFMISSSTGELIDLDGQKRSTEEGDVALWVIEPNQPPSIPLCETMIDAYYNPHLDKYQIPEWIFFESDFGEMGKTAVVVEIFDLHAFVRHCFLEGVWDNPLDCESIWNLMLSRVIVPLLNDIPTQQRPTLTARNNGVVVDIRCQHGGGDDWISCSAQEFYRMSSASVSVHNPPLRYYKKNL